MWGKKCIPSIPQHFSFEFINNQWYWGSKSFISKYIFELNKWEIVSSEIPFHYGACAVATDNYLYVLGGYLVERCSLIRTPTTAARRLNIVKKTWEFIAEMNAPRSNACGIATHGKILIAGGITNAHDVAGGVIKSSSVLKNSEIARTKTCEIYNADNNEWQLIASLNAPRSRGNMECFKEHCM